MTTKRLYAGGAPAPEVMAQRVLVVDDTPTNVRLLTDVLTVKGYEVSIATSGAEALASIEKAPPDLVLLDVMMPGMTGYEVCERLRADPKMAMLPVVMVTALDAREERVKGLDAGADDFLTKPVNQPELLARVRSLLRIKTLYDRIEAQKARVEAELESAREIQLAMVPSEFPDPTPEAPAEVFATLKPARQIGGDLYDFFYADRDVLCIVIADVSDKGAPAALFMAHTKSIIRMVVTLSQRESRAALDPARIMAQVNAELCRANGAGMFVTVFLAMLDVRGGKVSFCTAGHPNPYAVGTRGVTRLQGPIGIPAGIETSFEYETGTHDLARGDCLFLYTDGVTEAMNHAQAFYTERRLEDVLVPLAGMPPRVLVETVIDDVRAFANGAPQADDIAAVAMRI
jgi:sigma-B regulation protein RsbU (phosphoserine phosphatase)